MKDKSTNDKKQALLKREELAVLLNVSPRHISTMVASGKMPGPVRIGHSVRWRLAEINAWLAAGCPAGLRWEAQAL